MLWRVLFNIVLLRAFTLLVFQSSSLQAAPPSPPLFFANSPSIPIVSPGQRAENSKLLLIQDNAEFGTSIVTSTAEVFARSKGILIQFGGVGGNIHQYGAAAQSTLNFSGAAIKPGWFPIVLENPIYFGARGEKGTNPARAEEYSKLDAQLRWYNLVIGKILAAAQGKEVGTFGRSTGGSLLTQWYLSGAFGNPEVLPLLRKINFVTLGGITGYQPHIMAKWTEVEDRDKGNLDIYDELATLADRKLYIEMRERERTVPALESNLPPIIAIGAAQDGNLTLSEQHEVIQQIARATPHSRLVFIETDGRHDPTEAYKISTEDQLITVGQAKLFKDLLRTVIPHLIQSQQAGHFRLNLRSPRYPFLEDSNQCALALSSSLTPKPEEL